MFQTFFSFERVDDIESKIKKELPMIFKSLNGFLKKIESFKDPRSIEIMKRFIGYRSLLSLTSTLDSSQKEILRQFSNKVIYQMLSSYNPNFWDQISGFVNFLETLSRQCLLYKKKRFSFSKTIKSP